MLTEHFAASIGTPAPTSKVVTNAAKDAGIFVFESQPLSQQRAAFKKSTTNPNCLAVSASHVFAAQSDKAVVNVYNREKNSHEATVALPERIGCVALACEETVLVMGTIEGRIFLWETHTGRLVATSQAHLQSVTALAVDPSSNFLLSGSADSSIHVWSIPSLLSFSSPDTHSPLHTLTGHRSAITALSIGHSTGSYNIAVSASKDNTAIVWDFQNNTLLRTILLPATPLCLALDPADRAVYAGYEDGSVQLLHFFSDAFSASATEDGDSTKNPLYDEAQATLPVQPPASTRWAPPTAETGATLCMTLSYDGSSLTTGHENGKILFWDIPLARYNATFAPTSNPLPGPVTNLVTLPVLGFPQETNPKRTKLHAVVKPKIGAFESRDLEGAVPGDYKLTGQFTTSFSTPHFSAAQTSSSSLSSSSGLSEFELALSHPSFPPDLLAKSLAEFSTWTPSKFSSASGSVAKTEPAVSAVPAPAQTKTEGSGAADFVSLDDSDSRKEPTLEQKIKQLEEANEALRKAQKGSFREIAELKKKIAAQGRK